jgi:nucleoside-diphosphate-sugar epimerase
MTLNDITFDRRPLMRILVTGASGWIGSASVTELMAAGHQVRGLARSDAAAAKVAKLGAEVVRGTLDDVAGLRAAAAQAEGVVHFGYNHDFSQMGAAAQTDRAAIEAFAQVLDGSGGPLLIASGILGLATGRAGTEREMPNPAAHPRVANAAYTLGLADRGVRAIVMRFAPTVHGSGGDHGFVATLARIAREKRVSAYIGDGLNRWPAVHRLDAGKLVQLAIDGAPPGAVLHAVAEEGIATRDIAAAIGKFLNLPDATIPADRATAHFDWLGMFFGADVPSSSELTRKLLGWQPKHPTLLEDIAAGHYPGR